MIDAILPDPRRPRGDHRLARYSVVTGKLISARNRGAGHFCETWRGRRKNADQEETGLWSVGDRLHYTQCLACPHVPSCRQKTAYMWRQEGRNNENIPATWKLYGHVRNTLPDFITYSAFYGWTWLCNFWSLTLYSTISSMLGSMNQKHLPGLTLIYWV